MKHLNITLLLIILILPVVSSISVNIPQPTIQTGGNYSINVNNTEFHRGLTPQQVANLFSETIYYAGTGLVKSVSTFSISTTWLTTFIEDVSKWANYFTLDQSTPQTITGGIPLLSEDRVINESHQLVDKLYVDIAVSSLGQRFYMLNNSSGVEDYKIACPLGCPLVAFDTSYADLTDGQYVAGWISPENMSMPTLIAGIYDWHLFAEKPTGTRTLRVYWTLNERLGNGTEILIGTSAESNLINAKSDYSIPLLLAEDYTLFNSSSRVVGKVYAVVGTSGLAPTLKIYGGGEDNSHWEIPTNIEILDTLYYSKTENINATGYNVTANKLDMGLNNSYGVISNETDFIMGYIEGL